MRQDLLTETPVIGPAMALEPAWIDYNDHLNMAYYHVIFDRSLDELVDRLGLGIAYRQETDCSIMVAEAHVNYIQELMADAVVRAAMRIVDWDPKRIHCYLELYHSEGWLAATSECMMLHVDLNARKVVAMPDDIQDRTRSTAEAHKALPATKYMGRSIGIRR